jgi:hypothetical protein
LPWSGGCNQDAQECNGAQLNYIDHRSDNNCLIPVVGISGPQECVEGPYKVL